MHDTAAVWNRLQKRLQDTIRPEDFQAWFMQVALQKAGDGELVLRAPNAMIRDWLQSKYAGAILEAAEAVLGGSPDLKIEIGEVPAPRPAADAEESTEPLPVSAYDAYTFDNFIIGPCNRLAHAASLAVAEAPGRAYNPLFLHGSVGLGKTHLLQAIAHTVQRQSPRAQVLFLSCEQFVNLFIAAVSKGEIEKFRAKCRGADLLVIDDIQFLSAKERSQEEFFHTFNALFTARKQIVIASDCPPQELSSLEDRLVSRFKSGLVAHLEAPCFETRMAIIVQKARLRGMAFPGNVVEYTATHFRSNMRELEGAVTKLISYSHLMKREITLALAQEALRDAIPLHAATVIAFPEIQAAVLAHFGLKNGDLQSRRRTQSIAFPRQVCMFLLRELTDHSLEEIGDFFGGKDHTTVLYAVDKIRDQVQIDTQLRAAVDSIRAKIQKA